MQIDHDIITMYNNRTYSLYGTASGMAHRLDLITCGNFGGEIQSVQASPDFQSVRFHILPVDCDLSEASWIGLGEAISSCRKEGCPVGLAGGYCLTRPV